MQSFFPYIPHTLLVIFGPYGAGKDTLMKDICRHNSQINRVPSYVRRERRHDDGDHLIYASRESIEQQSNAWVVEAAGNLYATRLEDLQAAFNSSHGAVIDLTWDTIPLLFDSLERLDDVGPEQVKLFYVDAEPGIVEERLRIRTKDNLEVQVRQEVMADKRTAVRKRVRLDFDRRIQENERIRQEVAKLPYLFVSLDNSYDRQSLYPNFLKALSEQVRALESV